MKEFFKKYGAFSTAITIALVIGCVFNMYSYPPIAYAAVAVTFYRIGLIHGNKKENISLKDL